MDNGINIYRGDIKNSLVEKKIQELSNNQAIRYFDRNRGKEILQMHGYDGTTPLYKLYDKATTDAQGHPKEPNKKDKLDIITKFFLGTFKILKLKEVNVFYVEDGYSNLYQRCPSVETLRSNASLYYQLLFGADSDMKSLEESIIKGILPGDLYQNIDRDYIQVTGKYYWSRKRADFMVVGGDDKYDPMPATGRAFAKCFDTPDTGSNNKKNFFNVPEFDSEDVDTMLSVYEELKELSYYDWPEKYHFQWYKDWSKNRVGVEFGMITIPALCFMRKLPRGAIFNVGDGSNGKTMCDAVAISIIGSNNVSFIKGADLGNWNGLVNYQTTWMNIPQETNVDFLKDNSECFKEMSEQATIMVPVKFGGASVPVECDFPLVFNINKLPEFSSDAIAVTNRMYINNFDVDFSESGRVVNDYLQETFLSDKKTMPTLVGAVLAFAHYYSQSEHPWKESEDMAIARSALVANTVPDREYYKWFKMFFYSFDGIKIVRKDFVNAGSIDGETYDGKKVNIKDGPFGKSVRVCNRDKSYYKVGGEDMSVFRRFPFSEGLYLRKYMGAISSLEEYLGDWGGARSLVYAMRMDYLKRRAKYEADLKSAKVTKTDEEKHKRIMQEMYQDIIREGASIDGVEIK